MAQKYKGIREKIESILKSENTINFLNDFSRFGCVVSKSENVNIFINNVFINDDDVRIESSNTHSKIDDVNIYNKKINIKTLSSNCKSKKFLFKSFKFREGEQIDINYILDCVREKLNFYDYFFIIIIERNRKNQPFKVRYNYYLISAKIFNINNDFTKTISGYHGKSWNLQNNKDFCFIINI